MTERGGISHEIEQRVALFESINKELKMKYPDHFFNLLFPFSPGYYIWVEDTSGLYGNLETTYQLGEFSLVNLRAFLEYGLLVKKEEVHVRKVHNPAFREWAETMIITGGTNLQYWNEVTRQGQYPAKWGKSIPPEEIEQKEVNTYPIAKVDLKFLSAELKLGFVDHARGVETERVRREQTWKHSEFEALISKAERAQVQPQGQKTEPKVNPEVVLDTHREYIDGVPYGRGISEVIIKNLKTGDTRTFHPHPSPMRFSKESNIVMIERLPQIGLGSNLARITVTNLISNSTQEEIVPFDDLHIRVRRSSSL